MTPPADIEIRVVGREARDEVLPLMAGLQAFELTLDPNRLPPEEIGPHLDHLFDAVDREGGFVLLAEQAGRPVAFLLGVVAEEGGHFVLPENRRYGIVTDLFVAPEARRRGLAARMMAEAEARFAALGLAQMEIGTLAANGPARALYLRWAGREQSVIYAKPLRRS
ncbi:MAG: GNAT family N-acetyltransferase [Pseudomonadota bacterium]